MARKIVIIGGGASGLAAAVTAAESGAAVTVIEHKDRVGKKLLMTGNGKCNLTNMSDFHGKYYSSDGASLQKIYATLSQFGASDTREFFREIGLYTKEKQNGGVYPMSEQASVVLDVLRSKCSHMGVGILTDCDVSRIISDKTGGTIKYIHHLYENPEISAKNARENNQKKNKGIWVKDEEGSLRYDKLILATGSKAAPVTGSDGTGYELAKKIGHHIISPLPALVQLKCEGNYFKAISGVRAQAELTLYVDGKRSAVESGELQLTDYGISGIPVFQFSRIASRALHEGKTCEVSVNFLIQMTEAVCLDGQGYKTVEELLSGIVHKKIASLICRRQGIGTQETVSAVGIKKVLDCIHALKQFRVMVTAANSFENAQVCCGGVPLSEVSESFASLKCPDVYLVGELLDCDGICGGYNLQWAWATGIIAGRAAADASVCG